jgi:CRISPR-associated protein Cas1
MPDTVLPLIPVSLLNALLYCPRRFYYEFVEGLMLANEHVEEGRQRHLRVADPALAGRPRKTEEGRETRSVQAADEALGLVAVVDVLEERESQLCPTEYKKGSAPRDAQGQPHAWENDAVQVCAQGLLLEANGCGAVPLGFVYYAASRQRVQVWLDEGLRKRTLETVEQARRLSQAGELPAPLPPSERQRCDACSLTPLCLPEETEAIRATPAADEEVKTTLRRVLPPTEPRQALYVNEQGAVVRRKGERLVVDGRVAQEPATVPLVNIREVLCYGNVQVTTGALQACMEQDIPVAYLSAYGRLRGVCVPVPSKNVVLRVAQFEAWQQLAKRLEVGKGIVRAKVHNQRVLVLRAARERSDSDLAQAAHELAARLEDIRTASAMDELMGIEGAAARTYFAAFARMIRGEEFDFEARTKRPPRDPVNALLSFGYALLAKDMFAVCVAVGFDPYLGLFHDFKYGRPALALDLMEEFRPLVADSTVLWLLNNRAIERRHFVLYGNGCYLTEGGRQRFIRAYESRKHTEVKHPVFGYAVSYQRAMEVQARLLARYLQGEARRYFAFRSR